MSKRAIHERRANSGELTRDERRAGGDERKGK